MAPVENNQPATGGATGKGWLPGQSGNPGGRPKGLAASVRELAPAKDLARWYWAIWLRDEVELAKLGVDLEAVTLTERNKAGEWLTERGYGKAPSHAPVEGENPLDLTGTGSLIADALDELAGKRAAQTARSGEGETLASDSPGRAATA